MPTPADAPAFDAWLARLLLPGEPLWHRTYATRTVTISARKALAGLARLASDAREEIRREGVLKIVAKTTAVVVIDSFISDPSTSSVDAFFPDARTEGLPPPQLAGA